MGVHRVGPQAGHGLGGTRGVGRLQAVAGTLQESPQEGSGAGPARGPSPRHFLAPSSERSPAKRWASCVRRSSLVWGWEPRPGPRALVTHPRGPVQSDVLTDPVSFCPLSEGADDCFISSDSEGHERGVFFAVSLSLCIVSWCRHVVSLPAAGLPACHPLLRGRLSQCPSCSLVPHLAHPLAPGRGVEQRGRSLWIGRRCRVGVPVSGCDSALSRAPGRAPTQARLRGGSELPFEHLAEPAANPRVCLAVWGAAGPAGAQQGC